MQDEPTLTTETWQKILDIHRLISSQISPKTRKKMLSEIASFNLPPNEFFHFVYVVENFNFKRLRSNDYHSRDPFDHKSVIESHFSKWGEAGWLEANDEFSYRITALGEELRQKRWHLLQGDLQQLSLNESKALNKCLEKFEYIKTIIRQKEMRPFLGSYLKRILHGAKPPETICPVLHFIEHRMDLGAGRDDCHHYAWLIAEQAMSPLSREMVSLIWNGRWQNLDNLIEQQSRRGFDANDYSHAVRRLLSLKWIEQNGKEIRLLPRGIEKRNQVEGSTNHYFYQPWKKAMLNEEITNLIENLDILSKNTI